jgi:hypothetical protein
LGYGSGEAGAVRVVVMLFRIRDHLDLEKE